jgi:hypothetical protein
MIFFTRKLYQGYQPNSGTERQALRQWARNGEIYHAYRYIISPLLPRSIIDVTGGGLHDAVITSASCRQETFRLTLDTSNSFSRYRPTPIRLTFRKLQRRIPIRDLVGQWWLYEEVHLSPRARFNLQVLLTDGELEIEADDLTIERLKRAKR